jgi:hypothetical protein
MISKLKKDTNNKVAAPAKAPPVQERVDPSNTWPHPPQGQPEPHFPAQSCRNAQLQMK